MLAVIDYGAGNLRSVVKSLRRVSEQKLDVISTHDAVQLEQASHIVLPGVGSFGDCVRGLEALPGMIAALEQAVLKRGVKFLGICVGMQMLFEEGQEYGTHKGLGWLEGEVVPLKLNDPLLKIPHMGWNELHLSITHPLFKDIKNGDHAYFLHSYHARCKVGSDVLATTDYSRPVTAAVARGNIMGVQFHPEKSQQTGLQLLRNFVRM